MGCSYNTQRTLSCLSLLKNQLKLGILANDLSLISMFQFPVSNMIKSPVLSLAVNCGKSVYRYVKHSGAVVVVIPRK